MGAGASEKTLQAIDAALAVPTGVLVDAHYFNRDPSGLIEARDAIARLIEEIPVENTGAAKRGER